MTIRFKASYDSHKVFNDNKYLGIARRREDKQWMVWNEVERTWHGPYDSRKKVGRVLKNKSFHV